MVFTLYHATKFQIIPYWKHLHKNKIKVTVELKVMCRVENIARKGLIELIEWCFTPLSTSFQLYHDDSSHLSCLSWVSPVLGWSSEVSCPRTLPRKNLGIQCGSNPGPLNYKSNTLPLSHARPQHFLLFLHGF